VITPTHEQIKAIADRISVDPVASVLIHRLSIRTHVPKSTKEGSIRCWALAQGVATSAKHVRGVVLFFTGINMATFMQDPERSMSKLVWNVDAIEMAKRALGLLWKPTNAEINAFMESL